MAVTSQYSNLANDVSTTYTRLGYTSVTANTSTTITLSEDINNYREIYICNSYYTNGFPVYASIYMPVSLFKTRVDAGVLSAGVSSLSSASIIGIQAKYESDTSITVATTRDASTNNYIVVFGIK